jgi:hypothetical protein
MDVMVIYDTDEKIESTNTPDLLAQLLLDYVPKSHSWVSVPDENDPTGANWTPQWSELAEALAEIERFLSSQDALQMAMDGFTVNELIDEIRIFRDELRTATKHTSRFHLCVY